MKRLGLPFFLWFFAVPILSTLTLSVEANAQLEVSGEEEAETETEEGDATSDQASYTPTESAEEGIRIPRTVCHGRRIQDIRVEGNRRVEAEDVLATLELQSGSLCTDEAVTRDARALWSLGFFDDIVFDAQQEAGAVVLTVRIRERPAIRNVVFAGNDEVDEEDLDEIVTLGEGAILSVPTVRRNVTKIRDKYAEEGFFLARIDYELVPVEGDKNEIDVRFDIDEGDEVIVRRIRFVGNKNIDSEELNSIMQTSETGFFSFIASNNAFNRTAFDEDVTRLQAYYYDKGYLGVAVGTPSIELTPDRSYVDITVPIEEGPRFKVGSVQVREVDANGDEVEPLGGRATILKQLDTEEGQWFSRSKIALSLQSITRTYRDAGYAAVDMLPDTDLDLEEERVDVVVVIRRGPLVYIERINVQGNTKTRDPVIRREIPISEGALYNQTKLERGRRRINALGYFERVDMSEEAGSTPNQIIVNVEVAERSTGTFQVGAGFSSIESFILTAQIQQQNLFGRGQALALQLQLSGIRQLIQVRLTEPWFLGTQWSLSVEGFSTVRNFTDFVRRSNGGSVTIGHPIRDPRFRFFLQYRAEMVDIAARTAGFFGNANASGARIFNTIPLDGLQRDGFTSSVRFGLSWDSRDNRITATDGIFASASTEVSESMFGSQNIFVRSTGFFRYYKQLFNFLTLKVNTELGLITSRRDIGVPIFERFYLGGIFNVRGFRLNSLGPRLGLQTEFDPNVDLVDEDGIAVGGNLQAFYNVELEFPIVETVGIRGLVFTDGGNAWNLEDKICAGPATTQEDDFSDRCSIDVTRLRTSWGFGFRWFSPLGPLRFEWGLPFHPRSFERDMRFEFTIGNFF
ncbi:MAG: outer membrane protein assembly factor BamA [Myxococcota bacterium]